MNVGALYKLKENCLEWIFDGCQIVGLAGSVDHVHRSFARRIRMKSAVWNFFLKRKFYSQAAPRRPSSADRGVKLELCTFTAVSRSLA